MTKTIQQLLSVVLCLVICVSLLPAAAFAETDGDAAAVEETGAVIADAEGETAIDGADNDLDDRDNTAEDGGGDPGSADSAVEENDNAPDSVESAVEDTDNTVGSADNAVDENESAPNDVENAVDDGGSAPDRDDNAVDENESAPDSVENTVDDGGTDLGDDGEAPGNVISGRGGGTLSGGEESLPDSDTLLKGYFDRLVVDRSGRKAAPAAAATAGSALSGANANLYAILEEKFVLVAQGELSSTEIEIPVSSLGFEKSSWTLKELGLSADQVFDENGYLTEKAHIALNGALNSVISFSTVMNALMADHPYELFWYDKSRGAGYYYSFSYDGVSIGLEEGDTYWTYFFVAAEYATDDFTVNTRLIKNVNAAAANAKSIVSAHAAETDRAKLRSYLTEICALVSYNDNAANNNVAYGNPWQLIWVFDGDSSTNVVCEGYSKAFQYLCDLSAFRSGLVRCLSVSGAMGSQSGYANHMWNIVRLDDGVNYLVDVTNCDGGAIGSPDKLFLAVPTSGDEENGYIFSPNGQSVGYAYEDTMFEIFSRTDLILGESSDLPVITKQPDSVCVCEGASAVFAVTAENASSYRWQYQKPGTSTWIDVSAASGKTATYTLTTAELRHNGYKYRCTVKNSAGSTVSRVVALTVREKITITVQPASRSVKEGANAVFSVTATGADSYQWQYKKPGTSAWINVSKNGTTATYTLKTEARHNGYRYRCVLKNPAETVYTKTVTLTVKLKPVIVLQPESVLTHIGEAATFTVEAENATSYQWQYKKPGTNTWIDVSAASGKTASYTLASAAERHTGYTYRCKVTNAVGSTLSATAALKIGVKITAQPVNRTVNEGANAVFSVTATGADSYQWQYKKPGTSTWINVSRNGTAATYTLKTEARHNGYRYRCVVKNAYETVTSKTVTLTVR